MKNENDPGMVILAGTKVKEALERYPRLKDVLVSLSPAYRKLNNRIVFNLVSRWATFADVAKMGGLSICELLHRLNSEIGMEKELFRRAPDCIEEKVPEAKGVRPRWVENAGEVIEIDVRNREDFFLLEIMERVEKLSSNEVMRVMNSFFPAPLVNMLSDKGYELYHETEAIEEHVLFIRGRGTGGFSAESMKQSGEVTAPDTGGAAQQEVEYISTGEIPLKESDIFSSLLSRARNTQPGGVLDAVIPFNPEALRNLLEPYGFELESSKNVEEGYRVTFRRTGDEAPEEKRASVVIQSATPVVYPLILKLLLSERFMRGLKIEELKVWDKTEKHLSWIVNGHADISFSAVAAVAKLYRKGLDIKMRGIAVWDNFYLLTRGFVADDFWDLKGRKIHLPLIKAAPPYVVTSFLIEESGYNIDDFDFVFGDPFGRPEEIKDALVSGKIDAAVLREPEASMALYEGKGDVRESIAYRDIWERLFPGNGNLPNAGLLFKGGFMRRYPDLVEVIEQEIKEAVRAVSADPGGTAEEVHRMMNMELDEAELFLSRVHLDYRESGEVLDDVMHYLKIIMGPTGENAHRDVESLFVD